MNKFFFIVSCCITIGCSSVPKLSHSDKLVTAADDVWSNGNIAEFEKSWKSCVFTITFLQLLLVSLMKKSWW